MPKFNADIYRIKGAIPKNKRCGWNDREHAKNTWNRSGEFFYYLNEQGNKINSPRFTYAGNYDPLGTIVGAEILNKQKFNIMKS